MRPILKLAITGLVLGLGLSALPGVARAFTVSCNDLCLLGYESCVDERGLKAGCGREYQACLKRCKPGGGGLF